MLNIQIKNLNNKSRKGTYIYIKETNKPARYYKLNENQPLQIEATTSYYKQKYIKQKTTQKIKEYTTQYQNQHGKEYGVEKQIKAYRKKIQKRKTIEKTLKRGVKKVKTTNIMNITPKRIGAINRQILYQIIKDKDIIQIMDKEHNMQKIKKRLEAKVTITNSQGKTLATTTFFNTTPQEISKKLNKYIKKGQISEEGEYNSITNTLDEIGGKGTQGTGNTGKVHRITTEFIYRKG